MRYATERDWDDATRGNATADREVFERWALSIPGAPRRSDPRVWSYLIMMADEMAALERGAYGQDVPGIENSVAAGVVAHFQEEIRRGGVTSTPEDYHPYRPMSGRGVTSTPEDYQPLRQAPPPRQAPPSRQAERSGAGGVTSTPEDYSPYRRMSGGGATSTPEDYQPIRKHRPNGRLSTWWGDMTDTYRQGVRGVHDVLRGRTAEEEAFHVPQWRAKEILLEEMAHRDSSVSEEELDYISAVARQRGGSWYEALAAVSEGAQLDDHPALPPGLDPPPAGPREAPTRSLRARPQRKVLR